MNKKELIEEIVGRIKEELVHILVDREQMTNQEAIERIQSIKSKVSLYYDVLALRMAEEALENQKIGHWIDIRNSEVTGLKIVKCSECDYIHSFMHLYGKPTADYTYCPSCGARMVELQESEDK